MNHQPEECFHVSHDNSDNIAQNKMSKRREEKEAPYLHKNVAPTSIVVLVSKLEVHNLMLHPRKNRA